MFVDSRGPHDRPWGPQEAVLRASFPPEPHSWTVCKSRAVCPKPPKKEETPVLNPQTCSFTERSDELVGKAGGLPAVSPPSLLQGALHSPTPHAPLLNSSGIPTSLPDSGASLRQGDTQGLGVSVKWTEWEELSERTVYSVCSKPWGSTGPGDRHACCSPRSEG